MSDSHHPYDYTVETDPVSLEVRLTSWRERLYLRLAHLTGAHILIRVQKINGSGLAEAMVICHLCGRSFGSPQIARDINLNLVSEPGQTPVRINLNLVNQMAHEELLVWQASRVMQNGKKIIATFQRGRRLFWLVLLITCFLLWASFSTIFMLQAWAPFCLGAFGLTSLNLLIIDRWLARLDRKLAKTGQVLADLTAQMEKIMTAQGKSLAPESTEPGKLQEFNRVVEKS